MKKRLIVKLLGCVSVNVGWCLAGESPSVLPGEIQEVQAYAKQVGAECTQLVDFVKENDLVKKMQQSLNFLQWSASTLQSLQQRHKSLKSSVNAMGDKMDWAESSLGALGPNASGFKEAVQDIEETVARTISPIDDYITQFMNLIKDVSQKLRDNTTMQQLESLGSAANTQLDVWPQQEGGKEDLAEAMKEIAQAKATPVVNTPQEAVPTLPEEITPVPQAMPDMLDEINAQAQETEGVSTDRVKQTLKEWKDVLDEQQETRDQILTSLDSLKELYQAQNENASAEITTWEDSIDRQWNLLNSMSEKEVRLNNELREFQRSGRPLLENKIENEIDELQNKLNFVQSAAERDMIEDSLEAKDKEALTIQTELRTIDSEMRIAMDQQQNAYELFLDDAVTKEREISELKLNNMTSEYDEAWQNVWEKYASDYNFAIAMRNKAQITQAKQAFDEGVTQVEQQKEAILSFETELKTQINEMETSLRSLEEEAMNIEDPDSAQVDQLNRSIHLTSSRAENMQQLLEQFEEFHRSLPEKKQEEELDRKQISRLEGTATR